MYTDFASTIGCEALQPVNSGKPTMYHSGPHRNELTFASNALDIPVEALKPDRSGDREAIAEQIVSLAMELRMLAKNEAGSPLGCLTLADLASKVYSARRQVDVVFNIPGFAVSPAWDIVLDLYKSRSKNKQVSITSACIGAACPPTTALRWLQLLENEGLVERVGDPQDKRRSVIALSEGGLNKTMAALGNYL